jgi:hypothetical protein
MKNLTIETVAIINITVTLFIIAYIFMAPLFLFIYHFIEEFFISIHDYLIEKRKITWMKLIKYLEN